MSPSALYEVLDRLVNDLELLGLHMDEPECVLCQAKVTLIGIMADLNVHRGAKGAREVPGA